MAIRQIGTKIEPQIIPTNAGLRTFASPPQALQETVVPNDLFYVRNHWTDCPDIDVNSYRLKVDGEVERPLSLTFDNLRELPQKRFQVTFECCGNSPVPEYWTKSLRISSVMESIKGHGIMGNAEWAGVSLKDILEQAGVKDSAVEVMFEGADHGPDETVGDPPEVTYERSLPMKKALHEDTILAYEMNGEPLPKDHGYPLRLLVSGWYGMNSVKWLVGIHVLDHKFEGFYMTQRYMTMNEPGSSEPYRYYGKLQVKSSFSCRRSGPGLMSEQDLWGLFRAAVECLDGVATVQFGAGFGWITTYRRVVVYTRDNELCAMMVNDYMLIQQRLKSEAAEFRYPFFSTGIVFVISGNDIATVVSPQFTKRGRVLLERLNGVVYDISGDRD